MKNQETLTNQQIKQYIDQLVSFYGLCDPIKETALAILFQQNLYKECLRQVKQYMRLKTRIKIVYLSPEKYRCTESAGRVEIPLPLPLIGTNAFKETLFQIELNNITKEDFHRFISVLCHELSHIVLYGSNHQLKHSEMATDLCALVFGFEEFMIKGSLTFKKTVRGIDLSTFIISGYLSREQMLFAASYLKRLRRKASNKRRKENIVNWFKNLLSRITPRKSA